MFKNKVIKRLYTVKDYCIQRKCKIIAMHSKGQVLFKNAETFMKNTSVMKTIS